MATIDTPMKARLNGTDHGTRASTITVLSLSSRGTLFPETTEVKDVWPGPQLRSAASVRKQCYAARCAVLDRFTAYVSVSSSVAFVISKEGDSLCPSQRPSHT